MDKEKLNCILLLQTKRRFQQEMYDSIYVSVWMDDTKTRWSL